ncbi:acyl-CoA dehydrogenase [Amycolatopsis sp. NBRC 101858]|uniref:acyl-CoA dehydrogenase family protein n=1 Tax=Amycolatopsis sp. NBRC 101858 TaxID=3032200 RepID=UPI0024A5228D|nr:acyl-CoA dehydrogenase family protein [Amycolatopsis sp. NBRC 101858]GLY38912.1 acyl-CoA dehydrogenase [Amycolatopsis sp. NBRC 101858]
MSLSVSDEQEELRALVRKFLGDKASSGAVRQSVESSGGYDREGWPQLAGQLGLAALAIPEADGGAGAGPVELGVVLEEMGRALYSGPYFGTVVLAGQALTHVGDETARRRWLPAIAEGTLTATLAVTEDNGRWDVAPETVAEHDRGEWTLRGVKTYVVDGHSADLLLVPARFADGVGLFAVEATASGLTRTELDTLDATRPLAKIELAGTPATRVGDGDASGPLEHVRDLVRAAVAAEQVGGAARCLEMAVGYAKTREQFGRPIGSFQAIKHKCARLHVEIECARSAARFAGSVAGQPGTEAAVAASVARAHCSEVFTHAAKENIQIHGGIGYTWEHDAHLYLRRAKSSELLFGSPREERRRLNRLLEMTGPNR